MLARLPAEEPAHSELGASVFKRNKACPASRAASRAMPNIPSEYAVEGTVAHALGERGLRSYLERYASPGYNALAADKALRTVLQGLGETHRVDGFTVRIGRDMVRHVGGYVDRTLRTLGHDGVLQVEQRFNLSSIYPGVFGTADARIYRTESATLIVRDFKYGAGVAVEAEENEQGLFYGVGSLVHEPVPLAALTVEIDQPRAIHPLGPVRTWTTTPARVDAFVHEIRAVSAATEHPLAPRHTGAHCQFCPAAPLCPQLWGEIGQALDTMNALMTQNRPVYDPIKLAELQRTLPLIESAAKRFKEFTLSEALNGRTLPGFKLVEGIGRRSWSDEQAAAQWLRHGLGLSPEQLYEPPTLASPAEIEKVVGKNGAASLKRYITKSTPAPKLAPDTDLRPALPVVTASQGFRPVQGPTPALPSPR